MSTAREVLLDIQGLEVHFETRRGLARAVTDVDLQPCGGTHVARTGEIGGIEVRKIQKKGRLNRRVSLVFAD